MANENYETGRVTIQYPDRFNEIKEWNEFQREKKEIQDRYPNKPWEVHISSGQGNHKDPFEKEWWDDWKRYQKEISELMFKPNGNFDKFHRQLVSGRDSMTIETWLRGAYNTDYYIHGKRKKNEE
jgi:hypothetical protein